MWSGRVIIYVGLKRIGEKYVAAYSEVHQYDSPAWMELGAHVELWLRQPVPQL
jgi:hypothetical protein